MYETKHFGFTWYLLYALSCQFHAIMNPIVAVSLLSILYIINKNLKLNIGVIFSIFIAPR